MKSALVEIGKSITHFWNWTERVPEMPERNPKTVKRTSFGNG
jgi:hypothetical protein